jgi:hypothetical protein
MSTESTVLACDTVGVVPRSLLWSAASKCESGFEAKVSIGLGVDELLGFKLGSLASFLLDLLEVVLHGY